MLREEIRKIITKEVERIFGNLTVPYFVVEVPENQAHGDYAVNVAMTLAKSLKKNPMEIAAAIVRALGKKPEFKNVEIVKPGFINIFVSENTLYQELREILRKPQAYGARLITAPRLLLNIEFISANPTGPLHVGHGRGAFYGDALARTLKFAGHKVVREYYINDARASTQIQEFGRAILRRSEAYPGPYTDDVRRRLQNKYFSLAKMNEGDVGYCAAQEVQKDNRQCIEKILKIKFDVWYAEEKLYKRRLVKKALDSLAQKDLIYDKDGALWFRASRFGDSEDRVAIRTGGAPTYFLPDVAYHQEKLTARKFNRVTDILGADHHGTFSRVLAGLDALGVDSSRVSAIFTQMARLTRGGKEVKMSKRAGEYVALEDLVREVGLDAARYFFLQKSPDTHMDFDLDLAKDQSRKNPVYYVQYAHARIASIMRNRKEGGFAKRPPLHLLKEKEEKTLIKKLVQFPEVIADTARDYHVHRIARYAYELAGAFHNFYESHRVLGEDHSLVAARFALVRATQAVLQLTFMMLGISAPKKM